MTAYVKQFYTIGEVSQMLEVPIYTLRFWEREFPMFNHNRTLKGTRKYTPADIDMAKAIKAAVYGKGLKIEGAIEYLNKTFRRQPPRQLRKCATTVALTPQNKRVDYQLIVDSFFAEMEMWVRQWFRQSGR